MSTARPPLNRGVTAPGALYTYRPNERSDRALQDIAEGHSYHGALFVSTYTGKRLIRHKRRDALPRLRICRWGTYIIQTAITLSHSPPYLLSTTL